MADRQKEMATCLHLNLHAHKHAHIHDSVAQQNATSACTAAAKRPPHLAQVGGRQARGEEEVAGLAVCHPAIPIGICLLEPGIHHAVGHAIDRRHCWRGRGCCCWQRRWLRSSGGGVGQAAGGTRAAAARSGCPHVRGGLPPAARNLGRQQVLHTGKEDEERAATGGLRQCRRRWHPAVQQCRERISEPPSAYPSLCSRPHYVQPSAPRNRPFAVKFWWAQGAVAQQETCAAELLCRAEPAKGPGRRGWSRANVDQLTAG